MSESNITREAVLAALSAAEDPELHRDLFLSI